MYFLSGVMGGSGTGTTTEAGIKMVRKAILAADPQAHIIDPLELGEIRAVLTTSYIHKVRLHPNNGPTIQMCVTCFPTF